jgi:hypothetical protein
MKTKGWALLGAALVASWLGPAEARPLEAAGVQGRKVRVDGLLREWPKNLDRLRETVRGSAKGGDPAVRGVVGYDDKNLYVAMDVVDDKLVRTKGFGTREDHAELLIAFPSGRGYKTHSVRLYAGEPGKSAGAVKVDGRKARGAKIVESSRTGGYYLEASIPWTTFREARRLRSGMRAALRYHDADARGAVKTIVATSTAKGGAALPPLLTEGEVGLYETVVTDKGLPEKPSHVAVGDVSGSSMREVVAVYGPYLTIVGAGYRGGKEYFFQDMGTGRRDGVRMFQLADLTGDGKDEIIVVKRVGGQKTYREVLEVLSVSKGAEAPFSAFKHEVGIVTPDLTIRNDVSVKRHKGKPVLVLTQDKPEGVDPETYREPLPGGMEPALMPWDEAKSQSFGWDGKAFAKVDEKTWKPPMEAPAVAAGVAPVGGGSSGGDTGGVAPPPPPRPPSAEELMDRVYALYRKDRHVGKSKPRFDFVTNVAGDATMERVLVHGHDIVVFGKGFKGGLSYVYITIGVDDAKDVVDVTARDLTGDGRAEVIVRGVIHAKASEQLGGDVVDRHALFIYQVSESGIKRVFAAETGRSLGDKSIVAGIRFLPSRQGYTLELAPRRAIGWTQRDYPFPVDRAPYGGLEPLLVPWGDQGTKRYRFDGSAFVAQ